MAEGSLKMSIRVSKEERLNGGGPVPPLRGRWALRYKPLPGSLRAGWYHLGALGRERDDTWTNGCRRAMHEE